MKLHDKTIVALGLITIASGVLLMASGALYLLNYAGNKGLF